MKPGEIGSELVYRRWRAALLLAVAAVAVVAALVPTAANAGVTSHTAVAAGRASEGAKPLTAPPPAPGAPQNCNPCGGGWIGTCFWYHWDPVNTNWAHLWCDGNGPVSYQLELECQGGGRTWYAYGGWRWYGDRSGSLAYCYENNTSGTPIHWMVNTRW
jgi:hypothetical protein